MEHFAWMAWTWQTAVFFAGIAGLLALLTGLAVRQPEVARYGILGIETTRGDRLFISLLGSAFIHLGWLGLAGGEHLEYASVLALFYAAAVFRLV